MDNELLTVPDLSSNFSISPSTIYRWIREGKLNSQKSGRRVFVIRDDTFFSFLSEMLEWNYDKNDAYIPDELLQYEYWHQNIDYFSWLLKICYSSKEDIKRKRFRIDKIFQNYIKINKITINGVKNLFNKSVQRKNEVFEDLKRGWYNEMSFSFPLKDSTLGCSFSDIYNNYDISSDRFQFPSWKIVMSYYSVYFYLRTITLMKNSTFRLKKHTATLNCFKNNVIPVISKSLWGFPLNIEYNPNKRIYRNKILLSKLEYSKYRYCSHPRSPNLSPIDIFESIVKQFTKNGKKFSIKSQYTIFDFLLEFRIWANYLDISNLISLYGKGYKGFLDQNLSLILFIISGIAEISVIAKFGENEYLKSLQEIYDTFALNNSQIRRNFLNVSMYQRMKIYRNLGFISKDIKLKKEENMNELIFC